MNEIETPVLPSIGEWYLDRETEDQFAVVDMDEATGLIEVQYLNGEIGEFGPEDWESLELSRIEAPEDWTVALEPVEEGDVGYDAESFEPPTQRKPLAGDEQESVLRSKEADAHEDISGSEPEDLE